MSESQIATVERLDKDVYTEALFGLSVQKSWGDYVSGDILNQLAHLETFSFNVSPHTVRMLLNTIAIYQVKSDDTNAALERLSKMLKNHIVQREVDWK